MITMPMCLYKTLQKHSNQQAACFTKSTLSPISINKYKDN